MTWKSLEVKKAEVTLSDPCRARNDRRVKTEEKRKKDV